MAQFEYYKKICFQEGYIFEIFQDDVFDDLYFWLAPTKPPISDALEAYHDSLLGRCHQGFQKIFHSVCFPMMSQENYELSKLYEPFYKIKNTPLYVSYTQAFLVQISRTSIPFNPYTGETTCTWTEVTKSTAWRFKNGLCQSRVLQQN